MCNTLTHKTCCKCSKIILENIINLLNAHLGSEQYLCNDCFEQFSKIINQNYNVHFKNFKYKMLSKEYNIYRKFLKGKYDIKFNQSEGCIYYFIGFLVLIIIFLIIFNP
jgi:hypothetical protein